MCLVRVPQRSRNLLDAEFRLCEKSEGVPKSHASHLILEGPANLLSKKPAQMLCGRPQPPRGLA